MKIKTSQNIFQHLNKYCDEYHPKDEWDKQIKKKWVAVDDIIKYLEGQKKMCDSDNMDEGKLLALDCEINTLLKELKKDNKDEEGMR